jgi:3-methyladenine DNA glycosylase/8-oxoguanine DNA glycosylase
MPASARLDDDLADAACRALRRSDPVLGDWIERLGPCPLRPRGDPYAALVRSIVFQQIAVSAARAIDRRFRAPFGYRYPRPGRLLEQRTTRLRAAGLSRPKIAALRAVARAFARGDVDGRRLAHLADDEVIEAVTRIHGVGEWTAHMLLVFALGRPDVLPVGDFGIRTGVRWLYRLPELPDRAQLEALAQPWRPYRSVASWYLWRAADANRPKRAV